MREICSSNCPVVTGICDPNKSWVRRYCSLKCGSKLKYLNNYKNFFDLFSAKNHEGTCSSQEWSGWTKRVQNPVKHLRRRFLWLQWMVSRYLALLWIRLWRRLISAPCFNHENSTGLSHQMWMANSSPITDFLETRSFKYVVMIV